MRKFYGEAFGLFIVVALLFPFGVAASSTNGSINPSDTYAWSENIGWINFGCNQCNVSVTDSAMTGYAWSADYGWINLSPAQSGVVNDGQGTLSGSAWGENTGWIDFSGVTIDSSGVFSGYASGDETGQVSFNCANTNACSSQDFKLSTDWRPQSVRSACNNGLDDDGDGDIDFGQDSGCESAGDDSETSGGAGIVPIPTSVGSGESDFIIGIDQTRGGFTIDKDGLNFLIFVGARARFGIRGESAPHTLHVIGLDTRTGGVDLEFSSEESIRVSMHPGTQRAINVDGDGQNDLRVTYNALETNRVDVTLTKIADKTVEDEEDTGRYSEGDLLKEAGDPTVYVVKNDTKHPILNGSVFEALGFAWEDIVEVEDLSGYRTGGVVGYDVVALSDGDLIKGTDNPRVYLLEQGKKRPIADERTFINRGFAWSDIIEVADLSGYATGSTIRSVDPDEVSEGVNDPFTRDLQLGDAGEDVRRLQVFLNNHGFMVAEAGVGSPGRETQTFWSSDPRGSDRLSKQVCERDFTTRRAERRNGVFRSFHTTLGE